VVRGYFRAKSKSYDITTEKINKRASFEKKGYIVE
jgi:hypothetical protein